MGVGAAAGVGVVDGAVGVDGGGADGGWGDDRDGGGVDGAVAVGVVARRVDVDRGAAFDRRGVVVRDRCHIRRWWGVAEVAVVEPCGGVGEFGGGERAVVDDHGGEVHVEVGVVVEFGAEDEFEGVGVVGAVERVDLGAVEVVGDGAGVDDGGLDEPAGTGAGGGRAGVAASAPGLHGEHAAVGDAEPECFVLAGFAVGGAAVADRVVAAHDEHGAVGGAGGESGRVGDGEFVAVAVDAIAGAPFGVVVTVGSPALVTVLLFGDRSAHDVTTPEPFVVTPDNESNCNTAPAGNPPVGGGVSVTLTVTLPSASLPAWSRARMVRV